MYFISTAYKKYCRNKRSKFENLVKKPINGTKFLMRIDALHIQKKFDVIDDDVLFITYAGQSEDSMAKQLEHGLEGEYSLFRYSISQHTSSCVICIKFKRGYYTPTEFVLSFNIFSARYLERKFILRLTEKNEIAMHIKKRTSCHISSNLLKIWGFDTSQLPRTKKNLKTTSKFRQHSSLLNPRKDYAFKKLKTGIRLSEKKFDINYHLPQIVKVYCNQVENSIESSSMRRLAGVMPGVYDNDRKKYNFYPISPMDLRLGSSFINSFEFKLADENGETLKLGSGFASYIKVSMVPHDENAIMNKEYLTCLSSDKVSKSIYKNNSNNSFSIHLPKTILRGPFTKWYMSLLNISMPTSVPNIHEGTNTFDVYNSGNEVITQIHIPPANYTSAQEIINTCRSSLKNHANINIGITKVGRISFQNVTNDQRILKFPKNLALILGVVNSIDNESLAILTLDPHVPFITDYDPDLKITQHLYCKLVCEQLCQTYFGDTNEEILRFLPLIDSDSTKSYFQEFHQKIRVEINSSSLNKLSFKLTRENSPELMNFENNHTPIHMTLLIEREN